MTMWAASPYLWACYWYFSFLRRLSVLPPRSLPPFRCCSSPNTPAFILIDDIIRIDSKSHPIVGGACTNDITTLSSIDWPIDSLDSEEKYRLISRD